MQGEQSDIGGFVDIVVTYQVGGGGLGAVIAGALVAGEVVGTARLLAGDGALRRRAAGVAVGVAVAWTVEGGPGRVSVVKVGIVNQMVDIGEHGA